MLAAERKAEKGYYFRSDLFEVANSDAWPNRKEGTAFRGRRDAQRASR